MTMPVIPVREPPAPGHAVGPRESEGRNAGVMAYPDRIVCLTEETVETLYLLGEERRIAGVIEIARAIRNLRAELRIAPGQEVEATLRPLDLALHERVLRPGARSLLRPAGQVTDAAGATSAPASS